MQTYLNDELQEFFQSQENKKFKEHVNEKLKDLQEGKIDSIKIGTIPAKDSVIEVNGLKYKVVSCDALKGHFVAHILRPDKDE